MLNAITTLLVFQLVGETTSQVLSLPIPGPVVGALVVSTVLTIAVTALSVKVIARLIQARTEGS